MSNGKKTTKGKKSRKTGLSKWETNLKNFKFRFISGLVLVALAFYLALAFMSFFFTGFADRSKFDISFWDFIKNAEITVQNWTGKFGAWLADTFINDWFGVASTAVVVLLFMTGIKLVGAKIMKLSSAFAHAALITIWTSLTLGFFFIDSVNDQYLLLGGAHGYFLSTWLQSAIGWAGTFILILVTLFAYLAFSFDWFIVLVSKPFQHKNTSEPKSETQNNSEQVDGLYSSKEKAEQVPDRPLDEELSLERAVSGLSDVSENTKPESIPNQQNNQQSTEVHDEETMNMEFEPQNTDKSLIHDADEDLELKIEKAATEEILEHNDDKPLGDYDPTLDLSSYKLPTFDLLDDHAAGSGQVGEEELISNKNKIVKTLEDYKIQIKSIKATVGPTITLYEIVPAPGVRISKIKNLEDDIALSLAALGIRIIAPIPGRGTIGIEVPNSEPEVVSMRSIITSRKFQNSKYELPIAFGKTISNETYMIDLTKA
ncbi:MAG: DNA translocase FtsK 4TM domain-containing protein, partial [Prolixibacteraceae bacterium]|nr:DNA translocase FtsK 4TM domain-containing protein [Prolixibacteraceae bacterium]